MTADAILSRPRYAPLTLDPSGLRHVVVSDAPALPRAAFTRDPLGLAGVEVWTVVHDAHAIPGPVSPGEGPGPVRHFRSVAQLKGILEHRLAHEHMGLRLYAVGTEPFLWDIRGLAARFGLDASECFATHSGSLARRVQCVHCKTMIEPVTTSYVACPDCRAYLFVRDHFSKRLGAFQGVQADAEEPGARPPAEEAFP